MENCSGIFFGVEMGGEKIHLVDWKIACTSLHKGSMGKGGGGVLDL